MMKKTATLLSIALILSACATGTSTSSNGTNNTSLAQSLLTSVIDNQCRTELNNRQTWRTIALAMTAAQQKEWENKICSCASTEAPNQMTANEVIQIINPNTRATAMASVASKTVSECIKSLYK